MCEGKSEIEAIWKINTNNPIYSYHFCRWNEVMRKIEFWVEVHELNEQGEYTAVEVTPKPEVPSAGVFQLRQVRVFMLLFGFCCFQLFQNLFFIFFLLCHKKKNHTLKLLTNTSFIPG